jgi:hypothetical protein
LKQIRRRLTFANVMSSIAVFLVLGGAAFAAAQLPKNSVGKKQLKNNAVVTSKIKKDAVTAAKIKAGAVDGSKVKDASLTGADINLGTLGTVPSANSAKTAESANSAKTAESANSAKTAESANTLSGHTPFFIRLNFGESRTLATNGAVSLVAECRQTTSDEIRVTAHTTVNGAVMGGEDDFNGSSPTDFLNTATDPEDAILVDETESIGDTYVAADIDEGFVLGPEGKLLTTNSEGLVLGLNYGQPGCLVGGIIDSVG